MILVSNSLLIRLGQKMIITYPSTVGQSWPYSLIMEGALQEYHFNHGICETVSVLLQNSTFFVICFKCNFSCFFSTIIYPYLDCPVLASDGRRIVGGTLAAKNKWGWQASMHWKGKHVCGGAIISPHWVITAAHCFVE